MFDFLPKVDNCCFCINLRVGSAFIAIAGFLGLFGIAGSLISQPLCGKKTLLTPDIGVTADIVTYIAYIDYGSTCILSILSVIFLIAVSGGKSSTIANLFLISVAQFLIVQLASIIALIVITIVDKNCQKLHPFYIGLIAFPTWLYFMIVVRSYKEDLE